MVGRVLSVELVISDSNKLTAADAKGNQGEPETEPRENEHDTQKYPYFRKVAYAERASHLYDS